MHRFIELILELIFPRERRARRVARLTHENVLALLKPKTLSIEGVNILALLPYREPAAQDLIWSLKFENGAHAAELLSHALSHALMEEYAERITFHEKLLLIPVPLHKEREKMRGYNQVSRVAKLLAERAPGYLTLREDVLYRVRDTKPQTTLPRRERLVNVTGAFAVQNSGLLRGKTCILLDDVATTGSTLCAAREALLPFAREVICLSCAYA
jgi:ComF family protein